MLSDPTWVNKLKPLVQRDQFFREALESRGILQDAYHLDMEKVHLENTRKLKFSFIRWGFRWLANLSIYNR